MIGFLVCVCTTTEIASILVRSTFAEALGHEPAVKNHRKFWQRLKNFNPQIFFYWKISTELGKTSKNLMFLGEQIFFFR